MQGFINLNKAAGWTSHDCVARVRRLLKLKRVGHAGTLDPAAMGVLPIAFGSATRLLQFLPATKAYQARIRLGVTTTTDDLEGEIISQTPVSDLSLETVQNTLQGAFLGKIQQVPPRYSAIQVGGKRLYDLARAGETVEVPVRTVEIYQIEVLDWQPTAFPEIEVAIACGAGTYIRSIARDLGAVLQTGGTLAHLLRTESSGFKLSNSVTLETLEAQLQQGLFEPTPPNIALSHLPTLCLSEIEANRWSNGQKIAGAFDLSFEGSSTSGTSDAQANLPDSNLVVQVQAQNGDFLGIGRLDSCTSQTVLAPQVVYKPTQ